MTSASSNHLIRERTFPKVYRTAKLTALKKGNRYIVDNMERRKPIAKHEAKPTIRVFIERLGRQPLSPDMPTAAVAARPVKLEEGSSPIKDLKSIVTNDQGDWGSSNMSEGNGNRCKPAAATQPLRTPRDVHFLRPKDCFLSEGDPRREARSSTCIFRLTIGLNFNPD